MRHKLKTWPAPFAAVLSGEKRHEIRKADRPFTAGDVLHLREWIPNLGILPLDAPPYDETPPHTQTPAPSSTFMS